MSGAIQCSVEMPQRFPATHNAIVEAMSSLPARWRTVLWSDVMGAAPVQTAKLMRIAPDEVPVLYKAASAGLQQACWEVAEAAPEIDPGQGDRG